MPHKTGPSQSPPSILQQSNTDYFYKQHYNWLEFVMARTAFSLTLMRAKLLNIIQMNLRILRETDTLIRRWLQVSNPVFVICL
jgi:hypothetical protein